MKKVLVLDDLDTRHEVFRRGLIGAKAAHVRSYEECIVALKQFSPFDIVFLDHDLSFEASMGTPKWNEKTGTDVATYIARMPKQLQPKKAVIHSHNLPGRERMRDILTRAGIDAKIMPFRS